MDQITTQFLIALLLAIPIGCVAWTVTNEEIFKDFRTKCLQIHNCGKRGVCMRKLSYLPTCHYCFSHWVAAAFLVMTRFHFVMADWRGYVIAEFTLVLVANFYLTIYNILRLRVRKLKAECEREEALVLRLKPQK